MKYSYIYIITNKNNTTLYIGITSDLKSRIYKHKNKFYYSSFSKKYNLEKLVYYEKYLEINQAIKREKQLKNWHKDWKINLIKTINRDFKDLSIDLFGF